MSATLTALNFAARFQCVGDRCEDTCCAGLQIPVEPEAYQRLGEALGTTEADRATFAAGFRREDGEVRIAHLPAGHCGFLEGGLCSLHRRFGPAVLADVCASFPRAVTQTPAGGLFTASLACPEAARLLLLADDGAARVELSEAILPRPRPLQPVAGDPLFTELTRAAERIHAGAAAPRTQLVALAHLALSRDLTLLARADDSMVGELSAQLGELVLPWTKVSSLLLGLFHERSGYAAQPRWTELIDQVQQRIGVENAFDVYREARDAQAVRHGARIDRAFRHYARYQWARFPVADAPSPVAWVCRLALRMATVRFLLALSVEPNADEAALDAGLVRAFQLTAKHFEQHPAVRAQVEGILDCAEQDRFMKALLFATFL